MSTVRLTEISDHSRPHMSYNNIASYQDKRLLHASRPDKRGQSDATMFSLPVGPTEINGSYNTGVGIGRHSVDIGHHSVDIGHRSTNHHMHKQKHSDDHHKKSLWSLYAEKTILVHRTYVLSNIIGKGSFGVVRQGFHKDTLDPVAVKLEEISAKNRVLSKEYQIYKRIWSEDCGLPEIMAYGKKDDYQYLVMQILGPSLEDLFRRCSRCFSMKTVLMLADQMIDRLRYIHDKGFLHRDIKPENFLTGIQEDADKVFLVDLGLAKQWRTEAGHIPYRTGNRIIGTARYASINSHMGHQLSRRDDMESLGYLLVYFAKGRLPWQSIRSRNKDEKYEKICEKKRDLSLETLCTGLPKEFILYFRHTRSLRFDERPSYDYLKGLFLTAFSNARYDYDHKWDWSSL